MTRIPYGYLTRQFNKPERFFQKIRKVIASGQFTLGPDLQTFEKNFAKLHGTKYALGVSTGTDALILTMKALGIGAGDEVITVPNSFVATTGAIAVTGARPVFVDVNEMYLIDPMLIERALTAKTKAVIPVHLTGTPADMEPILALAKKHDLWVIEDAAQAVTARYRNKSVGSWGDAAAFSLHPLKNLNVWGDGGVITTTDVRLYERLKLWRNHGLKNRDQCDFFAANNRLDALQAAVADYLLNDIKDITEARQRNATFYDDSLVHLAPQVTVPPRPRQSRSVFHTYVIQVERRERLVDHLTRAGIETKVHYPLPIHLQKAAKPLGYKKGDFPVCEAQAKKILSLPIHQYLTQTELAYVVRQIENFYRS